MTDKTHEEISADYSAAMAALRGNPAAMAEWQQAIFAAIEKQLDQMQTMYCEFRAGESYEDRRLRSAVAARRVMETAIECVTAWAELDDVDLLAPDADEWDASGQEDDQDGERGRCG